MAWRVGVDSGGTFTDICLFEEETGRIEIWKTQSTPDDPSRGIAEVVKQGLERVGEDLSTITFFGHGTTVATNALIELRGVKTALITTDGFRDLLEIGRQKRPSLYDMFAEKPEILVPRNLRFNISERLRPDGSVEQNLDQEQLRTVLRELASQDIKALAVCFLYSFMNDTHEQAVLADTREELGDIFVSLSSEVAPEFREYERLSTTVVNAFLGPVMERYIQRLEARLVEAGLQTSPHLTQSNGGVIGFEAAAQFPVRTLLSGPSTGVVAAQVIAGLAGFDNVITFDVGGTSSDVALLENRACKKTGEAEVHGYPIKAPMLDIHTVGAGGGSIAHVDNGGLLKVGPESAGANPGPVCYDLGGERPTLTDANVVLQILNPVEMLGGRMKVNKAKAEKAIRKLAKSLKLELLETAQGIISVATANMAKAIRVISVQRGHDPRDYALMAFGGGGPLHAARLARELDIKTVIVPLTPGALCAVGLLMTDLKADFAQSFLTNLSAIEPGQLVERFEQIEAQALDWFNREQIEPESRLYLRTVDLRYVGQNYELQVSFPEGEITKDTLAKLREDFEAAHAQRYGFSPEGEAVELVTLRTEAVGVVKKASIQAKMDKASSLPQPVGTREVWMPEAEGLVTSPVYQRDDLQFGHEFQGPAVVEQMDTTTLILPGMRARVDAYLNLILEDRA
ncbi:MULTISPECIES: hydantoinase/oxoprolinase family protein [Maritalea]|jgi:N-methylhydantoinase A|uniref:Hydantoinase/oxoprolinase family protein n=1 Tax=Maritalea mediterranea TaxID=2909667 RepID=A0ABS9E717_9HYPH|nr:hydantoinase/oxoprolinase family protein [Maritalea mediterranea]MCF4098627.1 hydantoinase/oxoprolinase family protein [Maritalea mediterranea]